MILTKNPTTTFQWHVRQRLKPPPHPGFNLWMALWLMIAFFNAVDGQQYCRDDTSPTLYFMGDIIDDGDEEGGIPKVLHEGSGLASHTDDDNWSLQIKSKLESLSEFLSKNKIKNIENNKKKEKKPLCIEDDDERAVGYMASYISHRGSDELKAGLQMVYPALREDNNGAVQEDLKNKTGEASDHAQVKVVEVEGGVFADFADMTLQMDVDITGDFGLHNGHIGAAGGGDKVEMAVVGDANSLEVSANEVKTNSATFFKHHQQGVSKVLECLEEEIVFHLKALKYNHIIKANDNAVEDTTSDFYRGSNIENAVSTKTKQSKTNLNLKDLCVTAGLAAYFLSFFFALIVAWSSRDAIVTTNKKGKWDKSIRRNVTPHAFKFRFRNTIIFCTFVLLATSFNVWAQSHQTHITKESIKGFDIEATKDSESGTSSSVMIQVESDSHVTKEDGMARALEDSTNTATKPFTLDVVLKELGSLSHGLRGSDSKDVDSAGILSTVKDIANSYLSSIQVIQGHYRNGNKGKAAAAMRATVGDVSDLIEANKEAEATKKDLGFPTVINSVTSAHTNALELSEISDDQLAAFIKPEVFDDLIVRTENLIEVLEGVSEGNNKRAQRKSARSEQTDFEEFKFESEHFQSGSNAGQPHFHQQYGQFHPSNFLKHQSNGQSHSSDFMKHPYMKNILQQHKAAMHSRTSTSKLSKLSSFYKSNEIIMAKHQSRRDALGKETCPADCTLSGGFECNCERLFGCVGAMSEYDLAVLIAGGFIDTNPGSQNYGNFTISADSMSLFDAEEGVSAKLVRIKSNATDHTDIDRCNAVLHELFTACDPSMVTCSNPNVESFQLSTEQVCAAVDTSTKLLFEAIGDEYDGFIDESTDTKCEPLSCNVCRDFVAEFDRFYAGRDMDKYPSENPMRYFTRVSLHSNNQDTYKLGTLHTFHITKFPIGYHYPSNKQGIIDRTNFSEQPQWWTNAFTIVNPATGKALSITGTDCSSDPTGGVELRDHNPEDPSQYFKFSEEQDLDQRFRGYEIISACHNTNRMPHRAILAPLESTDQCVAGSKLKVSRNTYYHNVNTQWKIGLYGSIALDIDCSQYNMGNLAISAIEDDDVTNYRHVDFSFLNPATGKAIGIRGTSCDFNTKIELQQYDRTNDRQKFRLLESGDDGTFLIQSKACTSKGSVLSKFDCTIDEPPEEKYCIKVEMIIPILERRYFIDNIHIWVDSGNGYVLEADDLLRDNVIMDKCFAVLVGVQVSSGHNAGFSANFTLSIDGGRNYDHDLVCTDCTGSRTLPICVDGDTSANNIAACPAKCVNGARCTLKPQERLQTPEVFLGPQQYCIKGTTSDVEWAEGKVRVYVNNGNGYVIMVNDYFKKGAVVMEKCFESFEGLQVSAQHAEGANGWIGTFKLSLDGGNNYDYELDCNDCTESQTTNMPICVDGDNSSSGNGDCPSKCLNGTTCTLVPPEEIHFKQKWKVAGGKLELDGCDTVLGISSSAYPPLAGSAIHMYADDETWDQKWTVISRDPVLLTTDGGPNQEWRAHFINPPYNYALLPGFPGNEQSTSDGYMLCPNKEVAKAAMHQCDVSMSLLIGSQTSVGTLRALADIVNEEGTDGDSDRMPGSCCFDTPTTNNDRYFGTNYDAQEMECENKGPWHLTISEEACENAGGKWFRTPCLTLRDTINGRPPKFDLKNPVHGSCQEVLGQPNVAYVSASTDHSDFHFKRDKHGCNEFCRSLPGYSNQVAMMTEESSSPGSVDSCVCLYQDGMMPENIDTAIFATHSPPKFSLMNPLDESTLGIISDYDCAEDEISISVQDRVSSKRQKFQLTYDHRIVSTACPDKVLIFGCRDGQLVFRPHELEIPVDDRECILSGWHYDQRRTPIKIDSNTYVFGYVAYLGGDLIMTAVDRAGIVVGLQRFTSVISVIDELTPDIWNAANFFDDSPGTVTRIEFDPYCQSLKWNFNNDGSITNDICPNSQIAAIKEDIKTLESLYFSLMNPTTNMVIGIIESNGSTDGPCTDDYDSCEAWEARGECTTMSDWMLINCRKSCMVCSDNGCPFGDDDLSRKGSITLQEAVPGSPNQQFYIDGDAIVSLMCPNFVVTENLVSDSISSSLDISDNDCNHTNLILKTKRSSPESQWQFNDDNSIESMSECQGKVIGIETGGRLNVEAGATLILSDQANGTSPMYQKWTKHHETSSILSGPYSIVNYADGLALGMSEVVCKIGVRLYAQPVVNYSTDGSMRQKFYIGNGGTIHSAQCPGLVISIIAGDSSCADVQLTLGIATGEKNTQWTFNNNGSIESVHCQGFMIEEVSHRIVLKQRSETDSQTWRKVNTRLLRAGKADWNQNWNINFDEDYDGLPHYSGDDTVRTCYRPNIAFSPSFEDFAKDLVIVDASNEDQCRHAREGLGYDKDHPFDTEVRDTFNDFMCNGVHFDHSDHMSEALAEPPTFTEVEFEAPEYPDDPDLTFDRLPNHDPFVTPSDVGKNTAALNTLQDQELRLAIDVEVTSLNDEYLRKKMSTTCKGLPSEIGMGFISIPNPFYYLCWGAFYIYLGITNILFFIALTLYHVIHFEYEKATLGPGETIDTYLYAQATFDSLKKLDSWNFDALETINRNIYTQHSQMRQHLQDRHQRMTHDIVEFIQESTNTLGNQIDAQNHYLHEILCQIYSQAGATSCDGTGESHLDLVVEWPENQITLREQIQQLEVQGENIQEAMYGIHKALSMGVKGSKDGFGAQSLSQTEAEAEDLEYVRGKIDTMEGDTQGDMQELGNKMDAVESKVDAVESNVRDMKVKLEAVESNVNNMKDMMMQLIDNVMGFMDQDDAKGGIEKL